MRKGTASEKASDVVSPRCSPADRGAPHPASRVRSEAFVVRALRHSTFRVFPEPVARPVDARPGDLVVTARDGAIEGLRLVGRTQGQSVYRVE